MRIESVDKSCEWERQGRWNEEVVLPKCPNNLSNRLNWNFGSANVYKCIHSLQVEVVNKLNGKLCIRCLLWWCVFWTCEIWLPMIQITKQITKQITNSWHLLYISLSIELWHSKYCNRVIKVYSYCFLNKNK